MDRVQVVAGLLGGFQAGQVGVHHQPVALDREDQRDVDRNAFGQNGGDGGQARLGGRNLDQQVGPVDDLPQLDGLRDGLVGVVGQPGVHLDRHPPVDTVGGVPLGPQHVAGLADVVGGHGADGGVDVGAAVGEFGDLRVISVALGQRGLEDRRVGGDADDALGVDQLLQVARLQPVAGQVVEPDGDSRGGQRREVGILCHDGFPYQLSIARSAAAATASGVKPNSRNSVLSSADSP